MLPQLERLSLFDDLNQFLTLSPRKQVFDIKNPTLHKNRAAAILQLLGNETVQFNT